MFNHRLASFEFANVLREWWSGHCCSSGYCAYASLFGGGILFVLCFKCPKWVELMCEKVSLDSALKLVEVARAWGHFPVLIDVQNLLIQTGIQTGRAIRFEGNQYQTISTESCGTFLHLHQRKTYVGHRWSPVTFKGTGERSPIHWTWEAEPWLQCLRDLAPESSKALVVSVGLVFFWEAQTGGLWRIFWDSKASRPFSLELAMTPCLQQVDVSHMACLVPKWMEPLLLFHQWCLECQVSQGQVDREEESERPWTIFRFFLRS